MSSADAGFFDAAHLGDTALSPGRKVFVGRGGRVECPGGSFRLDGRGGAAFNHMGALAESPIRDNVVHVFQVPGEVAVDGEVVLPGLGGNVGVGFCFAVEAHVVEARVAGLAAAGVVAAVSGRAWVLSFAVVGVGCGAEVGEGVVGGSACGVHEGVACHGV